MNEVELFPSAVGPRWELESLRETEEFCQHLFEIPRFWGAVAAATYGVPRE
jgi:hypothetical protein